MSSTIHRPTVRYHQIALTVSVILLSIALPVGMVAWTITSALSHKSLGRISNEPRRYNEGSIRNGELWYPVFQSSAGWLSHRLQETRFQRVNLTTGNEVATGLVLSSEAARPLWMNDQLYATSSTAIFRMEGTSVKKLATLPANSGFFHVTPFLYDGQVTTVAETVDAAGLVRDDEFRLVHLANDQWVIGRKILLPGLSRTWSHNSDHTHSSILPLSTFQPVIPTIWRGFQIHLTVIQDEETTHLFFRDNSRFAAYRRGFEFVDDDGEDASAMAPDNFKREVSGWEKIPIGGPNGYCHQMRSDRQGMLFCTGSQPPRCIQRTKSGQWDMTKGFDRETIPGTFPSLMADFAEGTAYVIHYDNAFYSTAFSRVEDNTVQPPHLVLPGCERQYIAHWHRLAAGICAAWLLHHVLVFAATEVLTRARSDKTYEFGLERAVFASTWRRVLALAIDLTLLTAILFVSAAVQSRMTKMKWERATPREICNALHQLENEILLPEGLSSLERIPDRVSESVLLSAFGRTRYPHLMRIKSALLNMALVVCCLRVLQEGQFGATPGKWLLGIRTRRSTLRRCGIARSLVRCLMYGVDIVFFVTPLPAAISMLLSPYRQRLGDRVADTLVVTSAAIADNQRRNPSPASV